MKKVKIITLIFCSLMVILLITACNSTSNNSGESSKESFTSETGGLIEMLDEKGNFCYSIVCASSSYESLKNASIDMRNHLRDLTGKTVKFKQESYDENKITAEEVDPIMRF